MIDEGQKIPNLGRAVKLLIDSKPDIQVIVTGSSSFALANAMEEPLTGRKFVYKLLLEQAFIVFPLNSYSTNQRNEIKKGVKYYFYDNGVRNAVINDLAPMASPIFGELRTRWK